MNILQINNSRDIGYLFICLFIYLEKRLSEFHYFFVEIKKILNLNHFCVRQTVFVFYSAFIPNLRVWEW